MRRRTLIAAPLAAAALPAWARAAEPDDAVETLLGRMTVEEKAGQLCCFSDTVRPLGRPINPGEAARSADAMLADIRAGRVGMIFNGYGQADARRAQTAALQSRLGIPLLFAADVIHGAETIFPVPLAQAAAFDSDLSRRIARASAEEASAGGLHWTFAPMADVARDQRWGRVVEGSGEDALLASRLVAAQVEGWQGRDLAAPDALCATPKHFLGYGAVTGGMEYAAVDLSPETLRAIHLPPFAAAIRAGAGAVMASFTDVNGVPASANRWLLTTLLRDELGFTGVCVSDYLAVAELVNHGVAADGADAARLAILAGIDMDMQSGLFAKHLPTLVASGAVGQARLDEAARRVLTLKRRLGVLADPFRSLRAPRRRAADPAPLAREAASRAMVLLKNDGDLLPLKPQARIALIGPFVDGRADQNGPWSFAGPPDAGTSLADAVRASLADPAALRVEPGCAVDAPLPGGIERAVAAAQASEIVLLGLGEGATWSGEGNSRVAITLPPAQQALAEAVAATGRPMVVLLRHGRGLALDGAVAHSAAIVVTWFLGVASGPALADLLFGRIGPRGRLPVSFPFATGQEPWSYDRAPTGRPASPDLTSTEGGGRWRDAPDRARFPFGHGLTFTRFAWSDFTVTAGNGSPIAAVTIRNIGAQPGDELIQIYARWRVAARARPGRRLIAFAWASLAPDESRRVTLPLHPDALALLAADGATNPTLDLWAARHAADPGLHCEFKAPA